jgi:hypothetical protein
MGSRLASFVSTSPKAQELLMAVGILAPSSPPGLFITGKETYILRLVAHSWLIIHTLNSSKELKEQRKRSTDKPILYHLRTVLNGFVTLGSTFAALNALWRLTS